MRRHNKVNYSNKISQMFTRMKKHEYNDNVSNDEFFFFGVPKKLGAGTKKDPLVV